MYSPKDRVKESMTERTSDMTNANSAYIAPSANAFFLSERRKARMYRIYRLFMTAYLL